jgi:hypothetical protein
MPMDAPPPPMESVDCESPGRPGGLPPESVPPDVPLDPGSGVPLEVSFYQSGCQGCHDHVPGGSGIGDGAYIEPRTIIHVGDAHDSPICHSKEDNLV